MTRRTERVGEEIRAELSRLLREEVADPRIRLVTLLRVDVSPDLGSARVFWSEAPEASGAERDPERTERALTHAAAYLRRRLAEALPLRRVPELHFRHDPSLALGSETLALLREIQNDEGT